MQGNDFLACDGFNGTINQAKTEIAQGVFACLNATLLQYQANFAT